MMDMALYHVQIRGEVAEDEVNVLTPLQMARQGTDATGTTFSVCSDQSGLVGLLRHLHSLGFLILFFQRNN